jgi:23S rRNA pseudouridine1911/1915/1917 synthase
MSDLNIIYEDEYVLGIDKPSGLAVHPDGRTQEPTLADFLKENFKELENVGNPHTLDSGRYSERLGMVNRLDRDTSGVVLVARDNDAFAKLQKQFVDRSVVKEYIAQVWGKIEIEKLLAEGKILKGGIFFTILEPISRHKKDPRIWVCGTGVGERNTNREARTDFEILQQSAERTLVRLIPKTGRTHQLRLHMRFIGHPIVGDKKYGLNGIANEHGAEQIKNVSSFQEGECERLMLHAKSLEFIHPATSIPTKIISELPANF